MNNEVTRSAELIAAEINAIKSQTYGILNAAIVYAKRSCFEIGKRLEEAKILVPHGEWGTWLKNNFEYSESTASNLMRIYREYGDEQIDLLTGKSPAETFEGLSQSQLVELFALPKPVREAFVEEHREELVDGGLSIREMRELIREQKEKILQQEQAIRENDDSYAKLVEDLREAEKESTSFMEEAREKAKRAEELEEQLEALKEEVEEKTAPQEVTVTVHAPSDEQIAKIREEVMQEAEEKHKAEMERISADLGERDKKHEQELKEATDAAEKKIRQLLQKSDPHTARVTYCMEAIGRAMNDINAEVSAMEQEAPGSGTKMRMQCESMLLRLLNKCGWQV